MNSWYAEIEKLSEQNHITDEAFQRLLLVAIKDISQNQILQNALIEDLRREMGGIKSHVEKTRQVQMEYPSTLWALKHKPKKTITVIFSIILIVLFLIGVVDEVVLSRLVKSLFGLP